MLSWSQTPIRALFWISALNPGCALPESRLADAGKQVDSATASRNAMLDSAADSGGMGAAAAAKDDCVQQVEICNHKDDDCDGRVDELAAVARDCASKLLNQPALCQDGFCIRAGPCNHGFYNCDGMPANGCESACPCSGCEEEDAGP